MTMMPSTAYFWIPTLNPESTTHLSVTRLVCWSAENKSVKHDHPASGDVRSRRVIHLNHQPFREPVYITNDPKSSQMAIISFSFPLNLLPLESSFVKHEQSYSTAKSCDIVTLW